MKYKKSSQNMRRSCNSFNVQIAFLLIIVIVTIYISNIKITPNHIDEQELIRLKERYEKFRSNDKIEQGNERAFNKLPAKARILKVLDKIYDGKQSYIFRSENLPNDENLIPFLANGHIGFRTYGNALYMNGLYSGAGEETHRAWIPNYANIRIYYCEYNEMFKGNCEYGLNIRDGVFMQHILEDRFELFHLTYAHRAYKNFVVNQIFIKRREDNEKISLNLLHMSGDEEDDEGKKIIRDDIILEQEKETEFQQYKILTRAGVQKKVEDDRFQSSQHRITIMYNEIPQELVMKPNETFLSFKYLMSVSYEAETTNYKDFCDIIQQPDAQLLKMHTDAWGKFWDSAPSVEVKDNKDLASIIYSSMYTVASSIPTSISTQTFYTPMAPDLGHVTSLNEQWVLPAVNILNTNWTGKFINYRFRTLPAVMSAGFKGAHFPVKSAFTGIEIESDLNMLSKVHVTADISFSMRQYYAATHDDNWLAREGCMLSKEIANYWAGFVVYNATTGYYNINAVTGPDSNYVGVDNDIYTNVAAGYALGFGRFTECLCSKIKDNYQTNEETNQNFDYIASHLALPYDTGPETHQKFNGFQLEMMSKLFQQPDVLMLQYPLEYKMDRDQRKRDLLQYKSLVPLSTAPSISHVVHSIASLDIDAKDASNFFMVSHKGFVRQPFNTWCEKSTTSTQDCGQSHYIIGASAFLQLVFNGYAGVRFHLDHLLIKRPSVLPLTSGFEIKNLRYLGVKYSITVEKEKSYVTFNVNEYEPPQLEIERSGKVMRVQSGFQYTIPDDGVKIRLKGDNLHGCPLPSDLIGQKVSIEEALVNKGDEQLPEKETINEVTFKNQEIKEEKASEKENKTMIEENLKKKSKEEVEEEQLEKQLEQLQQLEQPEDMANEVK